MIDAAKEARKQGRKLTRNKASIGNNNTNAKPSHRKAPNVTPKMTSHSEMKSVSVIYMMIYIKHKK